LSLELGVQASIAMVWSERLGPARGSSTAIGRRWEKEGKERWWSKRKFNEASAWWPPLRGQ